MNNKLENILERSGRCLTEAIPRNSQGENKEKYETHAVTQGILVTPGIGAVHETPLVCLLNRKLFTVCTHSTLIAEFPRAQL
jgi:hypothetical protein